MRWGFGTGRLLGGCSDPGEFQELGRRGSVDFGPPTLVAEQGSQP